MLIPIGHTGAIRKFPVATISIICINTVVFLFTIGVIERTQAQAVGAEGALREYEVELLRQYDKAKYDQLEAHLKSLRIRELRKGLQEFSDEIKKGKIVPLDSDEYSHWKMLYDRYIETRDSAFLQKFGFVPSKFNLISIITSLYLHGGWLHLIGNMIFFWAVGGAIEDRWGIPLYLVFYHLGGFAATYVHYLSEPDSYIPALGASGAIYAVMGAFLIRHYRTKLKMVYWLLLYIGRFNIPAPVIIPLWFLEQFIFGITDEMGIGVAFWAHIGGFLFGVMFALLMKIFAIEEKFIAPVLQKKIDPDKVWKPAETVVKDTMDRNLEIGKDLMAKGRYADSIIPINAALIANPHNLDALKMLYYAHIKTGDFKQAVETVGRICEILMLNNRHEEAVQAYNEMKKFNPQAVLPIRVQFNIARTLTSFGLFPEAARAYYEFAVNYPDIQLAPKALFLSGEILLLKLNDYQNSYKIFSYLNQRYPSNINYQQAQNYMAQIAKAFS